VPPFPLFVGGSQRSQSPIARDERTVNWYLEKAGDQWVLYPTPGVEVFATGGAGATRALFHTNGRLFTVMGPTFYEVSSAGTLTSRGTVAYTDSLPAQIIADGEDELLIRASGKAYSFNLDTNTLTEELASGSDKIEILDGFFLSLNATTSELRISGLLDALTWDVTQTAERNLGPDRWQSMIVVDRQVLLLGTETSEWWYNNGGAPYPFTSNLTLVPYGIAAAHSAAVVNGSAVWLARTSDGPATLVKAEGLSPRRISDHAFEHAIKGYDVISDAVADVYEDGGHVFYILTFPTANKTWTYDDTTGVLTERLTWIAETGQYVAWRPLWHALAFGKHLIGDREQGKIYRMSTDLHTDVDGRPIRRVRRVPAINVEHKRMFYRNLELIVETGLGTVSEPDPQIDLNYSNDGGKTWTNAGSRGAGNTGEYDTRLIWNRLGSSRKRSFEFVTSAAIPWRLLGANITADLGTGR
jgi:hypothetical protein